MNLSGLASLLSSKKAIAAGCLIICATVLVAIGKMTVVDWQGYTKWIFTMYAGAETAHGVTAILKGKSIPEPPNGANKK